MLSQRFSLPSSNHRIITTITSSDALEPCLTTSSPLTIVTATTSDRIIHFHRPDSNQLVFLPHFTIDLDLVLTAKAVLREGIRAIMPFTETTGDGLPREARVEQIEFANESDSGGHVVVRLTTSEIIIYTFSSETCDTPESISIPPPPLDDLALDSYSPVESEVDDEPNLIDLSHLNVDTHAHFKPLALLSLPLFVLPPSSDTPSSSCIALSNIGFLAVSSGTSVTIVDLKRMEILFFDPAVISSEADLDQWQSESESHVDKSEITSLKWVLTSIAEGASRIRSIIASSKSDAKTRKPDQDVLPRLVIVHRSGRLRTIPLSFIAGTWIVDKASSTSSTIYAYDLASTFDVFLIDENGRELIMSQRQVDEIIRAQSIYSTLPPPAASYFVTVSPTRVSTFRGINGPRIFTLEGSFTSAKVVSRHDENHAVLVTIDKEREIRVFSLPELVPLLHRVLEHVEGSVSISSSSLILQASSPSVEIYTLFPLSSDPISISNLVSAPSIGETTRSTFGWIRRGGQVERKDLTRHTTEATFPSRSRSSPLRAQSRPSSSLPPPSLPSHLPRARSQSGTLPPLSPSTRPPPLPVSNDSISRTVSDAIGRTNDALVERGEQLAVLGERFSEMATSASNYAVAAKKTAQREAQKRSALGMVKGFFR